MSLEVSSADVGFTTGSEPVNTTRAAQSYVQLLLDQCTAAGEKYIVNTGASNCCLPPNHAFASMIIPRIRMSSNTVSDTHLEEIGEKSDNDLLELSVPPAIVFHVA